MKLAETVKAFLEAKRSPETYKVWVNTALGETWHEKGEAPDWQRLYDRRETAMAVGTPPAWTGLLVAGCDVHLRRTPIAADKTRAGVFIALVNSVDGPGVPGPGGVYRTLDGGATWTKRNGPLGQNSPIHAASFDFWWGRIAYVPGKTAELLYCAGRDFAGAPFYRSTDDGATWTAVPNVTEVQTFGFGKAAPGALYPTVFIHGRVNGARGVWRSIDNCASWTLLTVTPNASLDGVAQVTGDMNRFGRVYVSFGGSGAAFADYGQPLQLT